VYFNCGCFSWRITAFVFFLYWFKNLDFIGIRPDFASTTIAAAKKEYVEQWRPANDDEEEEAAFSSTPAPLIGKKFMSSKSKSFTTFLSGNLTGRVTLAVAPHVETDDFERYLELPQESDKEICVLTWWKAYPALYPDLVLMTRHYLAIRATSTACERQFSRAGRMHDAFKKNTKDDSQEDALLVSCNC
jgi:hypothetical protein